MEVASPSLDDGKPKVTIDKEIGHGGYGFIFSGTWNDGKSTGKRAFKYITNKKKFEEEKQFLENNRLDHIFIVKYFGTTTKDSLE